MSHSGNCPLRHTNGNCLAVGGFCTAIKSEICNGLQQAYEHGRLDAIKQKVIRCKDCKYWRDGICENDNVNRQIYDCGCYPPFVTDADWFCANGEGR